MKNEPYINAKGHQVLEFISNDTIVLNLDFILTSGKRLSKGMPYLKVEKQIIGEDIAAIRLLNFQYYQNVIYLNIQDLQTGKCYNLTWNMEIDDGSIWFWSLSDMDSLSTLTKNIQ